MDKLLVNFFIDMAVPKQRHTKGRRDRRRMHIFLTKPSLTKCQKCNKVVLPHTVCSNCGYYKGMKVIDVLKKLDKKQRKQKEKEMALQEREKKQADAMTMEGLSKK